MRSRRQMRAHGDNLKVEGGGFVPSECDHALKGSRGCMVHYGRLKGGD